MCKATVWIKESLTAKTVLKKRKLINDKIKIRVRNDN